jgi:hypothetical protein
LSKEPHVYLAYRRTLAIGGTVAAIVGLGGTALAVSGSDTVKGTAPSSSSAPSTAKKHAGKHSLPKRLEHGQFVTKGKDGAVTRTVYRGTVTAASATSITVKAADGASQTFAVNKDTAVRARAKGAKPTKTTIASIAKGDTVVAAGTGTGTVTAKRVVELPKK